MRVMSSTVVEISSDDVPDAGALMTSLSSVALGTPSLPSSGSSAVVALDNDDNVRAVVDWWFDTATTNAQVAFVCRVAEAAVAASSSLHGDATGGQSSPSATALLVLLFEAAAASHQRGVRFALQARSRLAEAIFGRGKGKHVPAGKPPRALRRLDGVLRQLLSHWFGAGFLQLQRVEWAVHSAAVFDFIAKNETVHPTDHLTTFKTRFGNGRRCLAFFHPQLPTEPVAFVHIALTPDKATSLSDIRSRTGRPDAEAAPQCATFYSIGTAHAGLQGLNTARRLILAAVPWLQREFPSITTFCTLSPIPRFVPWLESAISRDELAAGDLMTGEEATALAAAASGAGVVVHDHAMGEGTAALLALLSAPEWHRNPPVNAAMRPVLMRAAAQYLTRSKRGATGTAAAKPHCPVAGFHLANGAELVQLNWHGNLSPYGLAASAGIMANYLYVPEALGDRARDFARTAVVRAAASVRAAAASAAGDD